MYIYIYIYMYTHTHTYKYACLEGILGGWSNPCSSSFSIVFPLLFVALLLSLFRCFLFLPNHPTSVWEKVPKLKCLSLDIVLGGKLLLLFLFFVLLKRYYCFIYCVYSDSSGADCILLGGTTCLSPLV